MSVQSIRDTCRVRPSLPHRAGTPGKGRCKDEPSGDSHRHGCRRTCCRGGTRRRKAALDEPATAGRHARGSHAGQPARQAAADRADRSAAQLRNPDRRVPHRDHAQRPVLRPLPPGRHPADGGAGELFAQRRRRRGGAAGHAEPRRPAEDFRADGDHRRVPVLRQSPRPVLAACRGGGMGLRRDGQRGLARPAAEGRAGQGRRQARRGGGLAGRRRRPGAADDAGLPEEPADGQGDGRRGDHRHVDERRAVAAPQRLSGAARGARLDGDVLDEARQRPRGSAASRSTNFWMQKAYRVPAGMFPVDHPYPSQDNHGLLADHRDGGELPGGHAGRRRAAAGERLRHRGRRLGSRPRHPPGRGLARRRQDVEAGGAGTGPWPLRVPRVQPAHRQAAGRQLYGFRRAPRTTPARRRWRS